MRITSNVEERKLGAITTLPPAQKRMTNSVVYLYTLFLICSIAYIYPFMRIFIGPKDEGSLMEGAIRVLGGQLPCRDFFEVMGPGSFYWLALFLKLFGATWWATRIALLFTSSATGLLMLYLARQLAIKNPVMPALLLVGTSFGVLWPAISHHTDSNLFALLAFVAFIVWWDNKKLAPLFVSGLLAGLTTFIIQPKGILLLFSFIITIVIRGRTARNAMKPAAFLIAGYVSVCSSVLFIYWRTGALADLVYTNIIWPMTNYGNVNDVPYGMGTLTFYWDRWVATAHGFFASVLVMPLAAVLELPFILILSLPVVIIMMAAQYRHWALNWMTLPYWTSGVALWASELHRKDISHLVAGSPLLLLLFFRIFYQVKHKLQPYAVQLLTISVIALAVFNLCLVTTAQTQIHTKRGTMYAFRPDPVIDFLDSHVKASEPLFVYSYSPSYYFLSGAQNPTRFSLLFYGMNTKAQFDEVLQSIEHTNIRYVVWDNVAEDVNHVWPSYHPPPMRERIIEPYLLEHYKHVVVKGLHNGTEIWERKPE